MEIKTKYLVKYTNKIDKLENINNQKIIINVLLALILFLAFIYLSFQSF